MQFVDCARPNRPLCATLVRSLLAGMLIALSPVTSWAADWYVEQGADIAMADGSAANPFAEVQDAITAADDGDTIYIAPGDYDAEPIFLIDKDLSLIGTAHDPSSTKLVGHYFGPMVVVEAGTVAELTGLTVSATSTGVLVEAGATATLTRCVISGAHLKYGSGGGLYNAGTTTLVACDVLNNSVGVLQFPGQSRPPSGDGGGIYNKGTMTILDTLIRDNFAATYGGGIANGGALTLDGVSIIRNGFSEVFGQVTVWGGGIAMLYGGTLSVAHSTIAHNLCDESGGGLYWGGNAAVTTLDHTLVASNFPSDVGGAFTSLGHNAFDFGAPAQGAEVSDLHDVDPQFAAYGSGVLLSSSPCIDAGDPALTLTGLDLAGNPRLLDGDLDGLMVVDIGAHEFSNVQLGLDGDATPGGTLTFHTSGTPGLPTMLLFSAGAGEQMIAPYGTLLVDADFGRIPWLVAPATTDVLMPFGLPAGMTLVLQLVAFGPAAGTGNLSNAVTVTIE